MKEDTKYTQKLDSEFPPATFDTWRQAAEKLLKDKPFETLLTDTYEGIKVQPIYMGDRQRPTLPIESGHAIWQIAQELPYASPVKFNEALMYDLARGQTAINLSLQHTDISSPDSLARALAGIDLKATPMAIEAGEDPLPVLMWLIQVCEAQALDPGGLHGSVPGDPVGELARRGSSPLSEEAMQEALCAAVSTANEKALNLKVIGVDVNPYHNAGANAVQELACAMATAVYYLRAVQASLPACPVAALAELFRFSFGIGPDFFMEIAKLRAARMLWAQIVYEFAGYDVDAPVDIHARTSERNKAYHDPHTNILRGTVEALAAIAGGCTSLHITPFDASYRAPNEFSRRIARNTQLILKHESHFDIVADPAAGSWYAEALTQELAEKAWSFFQQIEGLGGMLKALQTGFIQTQIAETAYQRAQNYARSKDKLVGVNIYPNPKEEAVKSDSQKPGGVRQETTATIGIKIEALKAIRDAEPFERLRENSAHASTQPAVFVAAIGQIAELKARLDFSAAFFEIAGFRVSSGEIFDTVESAVEAALKSKVKIVTFCATDEAYPSLVPRFAEKLKAAITDSILVVAGHPRTHSDAFREAGVDEFIYFQANAVEILGRLQEAVGFSNE